MLPLNRRINADLFQCRFASLSQSGYAGRSGDAARRPNGPAAVARGSGRDARPEPAAAPDSCCTTYGCSAPAGEPRGR